MFRFFSDSRTNDDGAQISTNDLQRKPSATNGSTSGGTNGKLGNPKSFVGGLPCFSGEISSEAQLNFLLGRLDAKLDALTDTGKGA